MRSLVKLLATMGPVGRTLKAPGTWGSAIGLLFGLISASRLTPVASFSLAALAFLSGVYIASMAEREYQQRDPSAVIIDEVVGMWLIVASFPQFVAQPWWLLLAFLLFRFFDIFKPPPLRLLERASGGWGIMLDDLGAAAYTCFVLEIASRWLVR